jgi:hypothetical protein
MREPPLTHPATRALPDAVPLVVAGRGHAPSLRLALVASHAASWIWLALVPVLATGVVMRYLVPTPAEAE